MNFYQEVLEFWLTMPPPLPDDQPPVFQSPPLPPPRAGGPILYIQPTPVGIEPESREETNWSTSLCGCHRDANSCCKTLFCPCVTSSEIAEIVNEGNTSKWEAMLILFGLCCCCCCVWMYTCCNRATIREKFNIKGNMFLDCLSHAFCLHCALCQEYRELDRQGFDPSLGWIENIERQRNAVAIYFVTPPEPEKMSR